MPTIESLKVQREDAFLRADNIISTADKERRVLTPHENGMVDTYLSNANKFTTEIEQLEGKSSPTRPDARREMVDSLIAKFPVTGSTVSVSGTPFFGPRKGETVIRHLSEIGRAHV